MAHCNRSADFATLALPHRGALYAGALRLTRNSGDAEDLVQDTMLRGWSAFDGFRDGSNPRAWLYRIMTNSFISGYRRKRKEREVLQRESAVEAGGSLYGPGRVWRHRQPEVRYIADAVSPTVAEAIARVPEKYREVVLLADLMDFSYAEIADIVRCPVGTVMSRLFRGRQHLRRRLRGYAEEQHMVTRAAA
jgi:RNA polymerase sigma-70 factor, ECF subfamily